MGKSVRHHFVPQFYLRGFGDDRRRLQVIERTAVPPSKRYLSNVADVAVARNFYEVDGPNGPSLEIEKGLSELEGDMSRALARMLAGGFPPSPDDRDWMAFFVALQFSRGVDQLDSMNHVLDTMGKLILRHTTTESIAAGMKGKTGKPTTPEAVAEIEKYVKKAGGYQLTLDRNEVVKLMLETADRLAGYAAARKWQLLHFATPCLATSDSPVLLWSKPEKRRALMSPGGFLGCDEIRIPLDKRHALVMSWKPPSGEVRIAGAAAQAAELNRSTAAGAYRRFFHDPSLAFDALVLAPPKKSRIAFDGLTNTLGDDASK